MHVLFEYHKMCAILSINQYGLGFLPMKKVYSGKFFILFVFFLFSAVSEAKPVENTILQKKMDHLLSAWDRTLNIGIIVQNAETGQAVYKKNVNRYFSPASNLKLFTAWAALQYLGPDFTYKTQLFLDPQKVQEGVLHDPVYLKFSGDPVLKFEQVDRIIQSLSMAGIRQIQGDIVIDDTAFDAVPMSPGTVWDDKDYCFGAPLGGLMLERNCVFATLKPGSEAGQPAILTLPAYPQFIRFENQVMTASQSEKSQCIFDVKAASAASAGYLVEGCIKMGDPEQKIEMAVPHPRIYFQTVLSHLLNKHQIIHSGHVKFQKIDPLPTQPLITEQSPPLSKLLAVMLKESDNAIANALFKTMGSLYFKEPGSWENGKAAIKAIFSEKSQLKFSKAKIIDGSGLSRYNYVTPQQVVSLLKKAHQSPSFDGFLSALPISGVDGTLRDRMRQPATLKKVHAKTGTMGGVTALSGYLETRKKQRLIFAIFMNGFVEDPKLYKDLEDKICAILAESA